MNYSGFGNGGGNDQYPPGQGYPNWMQVSNNNNVTFHMYGGGPPLPPRVAPGAQSTLEPAGHYWPYAHSPMHQQQSPGYGMAHQPHHQAQVNPWNGVHGHSGAFQGIPNMAMANSRMHMGNSGMPGELFSGHGQQQEQEGNGDVTRQTTTQHILIVPASALLNKLRGFDDKNNGHDGSGGMGGGFGPGGLGGSGLGAGSFGF